MQFGMPTLIETPKIEECAKLCSDLGLDFIELNNNFPWYLLDVIDPEIYNEISRKYHIFFTIHLEEELNVCSFNQKVAEAYLNTVKDAIELAKQLNAPIINMHLNSGIYVTLPERKVYLFQEYKELFLQKLTDFRVFCEQAIGDSGIKICVENAGGFMDFARAGIEMLLESQVFALTFDIGHDHTEEGVDEPFIRAHKDRLIHMHLHDGLGKRNHMVLGDGEIDLKDKFALAKECNCRCVLETKTIIGLTKSVERLHQYL